MEEPDYCLIDSLKESPSPLDMTFVSFPSCTTNTGYSETGFHAKSDLTYGGGSPSGYDFYKQQSPKLTAKESLVSSRSIGQGPRSTTARHLGCSGGYVTSSYNSPSFCGTKGLLESSDFASTEIPLDRKRRRISGSSDDASPKKMKQTLTDARHSSSLLCNDLNKPFPSNEPSADIKVTNPFSISNPVKQPSSKSETPPKPEFARPPMSYVAMIRQAILQAPGERLLLQGIYKYIIETFPFFSSKEGWKNSVRHNLSLNKCFERDLTSGERKGGYWKYNHDFDDMFDGSNFRRRRRMRRSRGTSSSAAASSSFAPAAFPPPRPFAHSYLSPNEFLAAAEYSRGGYPPLRYPPCQRMQTFHYMQQPSSQMEQQPFPISLPTHGYAAPSAAFPGHYPTTHCLRESSSSQNHRYPPY